MEVGKIFGRLNIVWLALVAATCLSWDVVAHLLDRDASRVAGVIVIAIAFAKARLILIHFMELRDAPPAMRFMAEAWIVCTASAIMVIAWFTLKIP